MRGAGRGVGEEPWIAEGPLLGGFSSVAIGCLGVGIERPVLGGSNEKQTHFTRVR